MWKIVSFFLFWGLRVVACPNETQQQFLTHLAKEKMWIERLAFVAPYAEDTCYEWKLEYAWTLDQIKDHYSADSVYQTVPPNKWRNFTHCRIWNLFRTRNLETLLTVDNLNQRERYCLNLLRFGKDSLVNNSENERLNAALLKWVKFERKSLFMAGLLSALPGLGRLWMGFPRQAGITLGIQTVLFAAVLDAAFLQKGSPVYLYSSAAAAGVFWLSSVYTTIVNLRKAKKDALNALYDEITNRYLAASVEYPA